MKQQKKRPELKITGHYMEVNGELVEIEPEKVMGLPELCKLVFAEALTGNKYELVKSVSKERVAK